jgi:hypothetical protein
MVAPQTIQSLASLETRSSEMQECYFLTKPGKYWEQLAYVVVPYRTLGVPQPVGTLYRVALSNHVSQFTSNSLANLYLSNKTNMLAYGTNTVFQKVTDGVAHFRVRVLDANGVPYSLTNRVSTNVWMDVDGYATLNSQLWYAFVDDALPASVEIELGILEPQVVGQLKSLPNPTLATEFLAKQSGRFHVFEQRIPIRTAR